MLVLVVPEELLLPEIIGHEVSVELDVLENLSLLLVLAAYVQILDHFFDVVVIVL